MGLFGEKCFRCGKMTRSSHEGLPTCEACEMQIKADREEKRTCPIDGTRMNKEVIMNVVIDRCLSCHGVWLDGGELDLIKKAIVEKEGGDFVTGLIVGMAID